MIRQIRCLGIASWLVLASVGFAQTDYNMSLTGTYDQDNWGGAYVSPYTGTIDGSNALIICDDYTTDVNVGLTWTATAENAGSLNASEPPKFWGKNGNGPNSGVSSGYTAQQDYDAVAWLANQLMLPADLDNGTLQADYSYAIWNIFDPGLTTLNGQNSYGPDGGASALITEAYNEVVNDHYVATNVVVYTPNPLTASQEYLVVTAPEPAAAAVLGFDLLSVLAILFLLRRYRVRA